MKPTDLRGILRYIPRFRDRTFVISVDGAVLAHENFFNLLLDIAVLRSLNIRVVLVHGAAHQVRMLAEEQGKEATDYDGEGVTDKVTKELALSSAARLTQVILEALSINDLRGAVINGVTAHPKGIIQGVDHKWTGRVERIDSDMFQSLLGQGIIPVVPPLGFDGEGKTYRLNSDHLAGELAARLKAIKLIYVTTENGLIHQGELVRQMQVDELDRILKGKQGTFPPESLSKARYSSRACHDGVPRVHVINGLVHEGLLAEVFSNEGIGTLVYANEYRQIRPARKRDVRSILALTKQAMDKEELLRRDRRFIERNLNDYYIYEMDNNPVACVALHVYEATRQGEIASLFVGTAHENQGIGRRLVRFAEEEAARLGLEEIVVLSTQAYNYFQSKAGYSEASVESLPAARQEQYERSARRSRILVKKLPPR